MFLCRQPKILLVAFVAGISILSCNIYAQQREEARYVVAGVDCNDDEHAKAILDHASIDAKKDETIFIIPRLGTGESSRSLSRRRLYAPRHYLMGTRGIPENRIIIAEGERVKGLGHVEVYLGGKLFALFKMKRHRDFGQGPLCKIIFD
jgi:hypothetical protein